MYLVRQAHSIGVPMLYFIGALCMLFMVLLVFLYVQVIWLYIYIYMFSMCIYVVPATPYLAMPFL